ncbi:hypothetical protein H6G41_23590 [Tolypothrix sp. FACHB-123]|nr:hypothetical protein [Tolypothrix sp. FACHB-123]MBD2357560.1 hypothetical protein [Tolypothrix sp. FACHB-123]
MLSILSSTLEVLIFLFIAAFVSGFFLSDFAKKSESSTQVTGNKAIANK